jgi:hypothetical protein
MAAEAGEAVLHITCTTLVTKPSSLTTGCSAVTEADGKGKGGVLTAICFSIFRR